MKTVNVFFSNRFFSLKERRKEVTNNSVNPKDMKLQQYCVETPAITALAAKAMYVLRVPFNRCAVKYAITYVIKKKTLAIAKCEMGGENHFDRLSQKILKVNIRLFSLAKNDKKKTDTNV